MPLSENALDEMVARERERGAPPLTDWDSLSVRLRAEGLIRDAVPARFTSQRWMQIAAGLVLAVGGVAAGRASAGASLLPTAASTVASSDVASNDVALEWRRDERVAHIDAIGCAVQVARRSVGNTESRRRRISARISVPLGQQQPDPDADESVAVSHATRCTRQRDDGNSRSTQGSAAGSGHQSVLPHDSVSA